MDVTFLEHQAYFPKTQLQGEISRNSSSYQFWDIAILADIALPAPIFKSATSTAPITTSKSSLETTIVPSNWQRSIPKTCWEVDLFIQTRLDIAFPISVVSQFMQAPTEEHLSAVHRILQYLKMTLGKGLLFGKNTKWGIEIYSDADWAGSMKDRRPTSGYCTYVWGNLVTWFCKKQSVVAQSSAEAEFQAIALGACEGLWLKHVMEELRFQVSFQWKCFVIIKQPSTSPIIQFIMIEPDMWK